MIINDDCITSIWRLTGNSLKNVNKIVNKLDHEIVNKLQHEIVHEIVPEIVYRLLKRYQQYFQADRQEQQTKQKEEISGLWKILKILLQKKFHPIE